MIPKGRRLPIGIFRSENLLLRPKARAIVLPVAQGGKKSTRTERGRALGARLRALRRTRGWTLAHVARRSGLAISTISKIERGLLAPAYYKLNELARALGIDAGDLLEPTRRRGFANGAVVTDRKSTRLNSSHIQKSRMPSSA